MNNTQQQQWEAWCASRPPQVQEMARKYPPGTHIQHKNGTFWVVGYTEGNDLLVSETNPAVDYDKAVETRRAVCACCVAKLLHENP